MALALHVRLYMRASAWLIIFSLLLSLAGCSGLRHGDVKKVSAISDRPRAGNVYLVRGFIGVFSTGMDELAEKIRADGVRATVFQSDQRGELTRAIRKAYSTAPNAEPLVLIGHSYGADDVLRISRELADSGIGVDLVVTCDAVIPPAVPGNITEVRNYYKPQGPLDRLPWLRGIPLTAEQPGSVQLANFDITGNRDDLYLRGTNHFNIEKNQKIHQDILARLKTICPERQVWASRRREAESTLAAARRVNSPPNAPGSARSLVQTDDAMLIAQNENPSEADHR